MVAWITLRCVKCKFKFLAFLYFFPKHAVLVKNVQIVVLLFVFSYYFSLRVLFHRMAIVEG